MLNVNTAIRLAEPAYTMSHQRAVDVGGDVFFGDLKYYRILMKTKGRTLTVM